MFKQSVSLVEFSKLYNILYESNDLFSFNIFNYQNSKEFLKEIESNNDECINSTIIVDKKDHVLMSNNKININNILVMDTWPLKIEKLLDKINTQLIKQKYNFHSKLDIKNYTLNFNSRIISNKMKELKLTEREIDIILFLKDNSNPQSVSMLQNKVWGYSSDLETHTVETHIYRLRKKIKDKFDDENFIFSEDAGYKI
tara:strand:+ start:2296 stop:2892 length:597 start_codon:yes stop_codon:yes gene_type:complete